MPRMAIDNGVQFILTSLYGRKIPPSYLGNEVGDVTAYNILFQVCDAEARYLYYCSTEFDLEHIFLWRKEISIYSRNMVCSYKY